MSGPYFPTGGLSEYEKRVRDHGLLAAIAFLVLIPVGTLIPRYLRTFTNRWWWGHWITNFLFAGPLIIASWVLGHKAHKLSDSRMDHHKTIGFAIFGLYIAQVVLGAFIHFVRIPLPFLHGHRPPQNYMHPLLGLAILAMAEYQVHYGIYIQWPRKTANIHPVKESAKHAWLALVIVFWVLYAIGLAFLPRQYKQERESRLAKEKGDS